MTTNLALKTFMVLREHFYDDDANPKRFQLREKRNTQDDPFDEYICDVLRDGLKSQNAHCQKSSGPLISPDMAIYKDGVDLSNPNTENNSDEVIGIEVKKLERGKNGKIARATGLDYNSTPPCGKIRVYTEDDKPIIIKGFYLFACLETEKNGANYVSAMTLCDGSILNDDFDLYMQITGEREKGINLGTYGDGANRNRPMLIFSNPLGAPIMDKKVTLISELDLLGQVGNIGLTWKFQRKGNDGKNHIFFVYKDKKDIPDDHQVEVVNEPFPTPEKRVTETQGRGHFKLLLEYYRRIGALNGKKDDTH